MNQPVWNMQVAPESKGHESDGALTAGNYEPFFGARDCLAPQRLQDRFELGGLEGRNGWGSFRIRIEHLNPIQGKRGWPEVSQMQLIRDIEVWSAWECRGLERHAHLELCRPLS
jgi:hypothetical protein